MSATQRVAGEPVANNRDPFYGRVLEEVETATVLLGVSEPTLCRAADYTQFYVSHCRKPGGRVTPAFLADLEAAWGLKFEVTAMRPGGRLS